MKLSFCAQNRGEVGGDLRRDLTKDLFRVLEVKLRPTPKVLEVGVLPTLRVLQGYYNGGYGQLRGNYRGTSSQLQGYLRPTSRIHTTNIRDLHGKMGAHPGDNFDLDEALNFIEPQDYDS